MLILNLYLIPGTTKPTTHSCMNHDDMLVCVKIKKFYLTVSNNDDVTAALASILALMFARTGAPKPIDESCRLVNYCKLIQ